MYKSQGKLFWECIIFTGGKRLIFSTVFQIISLDCQEATYDHSAITCWYILINF